MAIIKAPGKFEGEQNYVKYFWNEVIGQGGGDEIYFEDTGEVIYIVEVEPEDIKLFPSLKAVKFVLLNETTDGFVRGEVADQARVDELMAESEDTGGGEE
jgi:hypothetical protein